MIFIKKICLDAGHGFNTSGKRTPAGINGVVREWVMNNAVCNYIADFLSEYEVEITRTDDPTGIEDVALAARTNTINRLNPDLFISIHHNAAGNGSEWSSATGAEVFSHPDKPKRDADLAGLLSVEMSKIIGLRNRGAKQANFHMVRETMPTIPSVIAEGGFMDGTNDYLIITSEKGQRAYARAAANICISYLELTPKKQDTEQQYNELKKLIDGLTRENRQLREDLNNWTQNSRILYSRVDNNIPEWARYTVIKMVEKGYLKGNEQGRLQLSNDMIRIFVVLDRAGAYDN